ncbi:MAG: tRNA (adenosine(37)-N6)-threonylcarbamoyltransferase complex dimerization subunit type 1 TsaB [Pseudomonadota bacterium]
MKLFAIDTALAAASVAIWADGAVVHIESLALERGHADKAPPLAKAAFAATGLAVRDMDRIAVTVGPGSFTGLRAGLAFARGLALGTGDGGAALPVVGVTTLQAFAAMAPPASETEAVLAVIDAKRGEVFFQMFEGETDAPLTAPAAAAPETVKAEALAAAEGRPLRLTGSAAIEMAALLQAAGAPVTVANAEGAPDIAAVARWAAGAPAPTGPPEPVYLRPPDAKPQAPSALALSVEGAKKPQ